MWPRACQPLPRLPAQLLGAIADLEDPQVGFRLLRVCAGHARLVHGMRCRTPNAQLPALQHSDAFVQGCLSNLAGLHLNASETQQTHRGLFQAGLGPRATPALIKRMEPAVFVTELRHRLMVPDAVEDAWRPECDAVLDRYFLHAGTCVAGGERAQRHNVVRDVLCSWADRAGLQPEDEKPGLLLPQKPGEAGQSLQRSPIALDIAVTACQRMETLAETGREAVAAAGDCARSKEFFFFHGPFCVCM